MTALNDEATHPKLDSRRIYRFFWPLALSWLFMSVEGPACVGFLSRLPDAILNTAAFNLLMSLALFIESPVIDLLSTSTTLATNRQSYQALRRFVLGLMALQTVIHAAFVLTPLYVALTQDLMRIPPEIADAARSGLTVMIPWSACIGWRRFHQGILIRHGRTKQVGAGTFVRMSTLFVAASVFVGMNVGSGAFIAGLALICSVAAEALFAQFAAKPVVAELEGKEDGGERLTLSKLSRFHFPLTATTMVMFVGGPLISSALAQASHGELSMAAWQVASSLLWITRASVYALPEVVITLGRHGRQESAALFRFCCTTGAICTLVVIAAHLLRLDQFLFAQVLRASPEVLPMAGIAFLLGWPLPAIAALQSYLRGMLTVRHHTTSRLFAIGAGVITLFACLRLGVSAGWSGVHIAGYSTIAALVAELLALTIAWGAVRHDPIRGRQLR